MSSLLTSCITTVLIHYKEYCGGIFTNTGINCFWIINNSQSIILSMQALNSTSKARSMNTYDFSTLYTSIPHNSLKFIMKELIEEAFRVRGAQYLSFNNRGKCYCSGEKRGEVNISESMLVEMVYYLVDNIYVLVGDKIFCQCIGIPMGTDSAPLLANLYLFKFEYTFMKNLLKTNMSKARLFNNTFRYIDDLLTLNNPSFDNEIKTIYPSESVLKKQLRMLAPFPIWMLV